MNKSNAQIEKEAAAAIEILRAVGLAIKELKEVPSGELYARMSGHMSLTTYNQIIKILTDGEMIKVTNHLIIWTGPQ